jgi:hypothetical protein
MYEPLPISDLYCSSRVEISVIIALSSGSYFLLRAVDAQFGITNAASTPRIAMTTPSSMIVKPASRLRDSIGSRTDPC